MDVARAGRAEAPPTMTGSYIDERIETMPRDQLERLQRARLGTMLDFVCERSPLIADAWQAAGVRAADIRSLDDFFAKAPFLTKDSIRQFRDTSGDPCGGLNCLDPAEMVGIGSTSGTTGDPTPIPHGRRSAFDHAKLRDYWHIGVRPGDFVLFMLFTFRRGHGQRLMADAGFTPICLTHRPGDIVRFVEASIRYRPTMCLIINHPVIHALEQHFERSGQDPRDVFASYKGGIFGGEALSARQRRITDGWGLELFEMTSFGDLGAATECRAHDGMHGFEDLVLVECLDPETDAPVADGEIGELVVTSLVDRYLPLIRYRTDDLVRIDRKPCVCGRTHLRIWPVGRKTDQIVVQGRSIVPREVQAVVDTHHETRGGLFQIIRRQRESDELALRVGYMEDTAPGRLPGLRDDLQDSVGAAFGVPVRVELVAEAELLKLGPPHKIPRVTKQ